MPVVRRRKAVFAIPPLPFDTSSSPARDFSVLIFLIAVFVCFGTAGFLSLLLEQDFASSCPDTPRILPWVARIFVVPDVAATVVHSVAHRSVRQRDLEHPAVVKNNLAQVQIRAYLTDALHHTKFFGFGLSSFSSAFKSNEQPWWRRRPFPRSTHSTR